MLRKSFMKGESFKDWLNAFSIDYSTLYYIQVLAFTNKPDLRLANLIG